MNVTIDEVIQFVNNYRTNHEINYSGELKLGNTILPDTY